MTTQLTELEELGFLVFGGQELQQLQGGVIPDPQEFPVATFHVLRSSNPTIVKVDLAKADDGGRPLDAWGPPRRAGLLLVSIAES